MQHGKKYCILVSNDIDILNIVAVGCRCLSSSKLMQVPYIFAFILLCTCFSHILSAALLTFSLSLCLFVISIMKCLFRIVNYANKLLHILLNFGQINYGTACGFGFKEKSSNRSTTLTDYATEWLLKNFYLFNYFDHFNYLCDNRIITFRVKTPLNWCKIV